MNPSSWLGNITTGGAISPAQGIEFFTKKLIPFLVNIGLFVIVLLSLIFLLVGGIMWITSGGEKEALAKAKGTITYAIIGLVSGLSVFIILNLIGYIFGVKLGL